MIRDMATSGAAKLVAACVCPIAGTAAVTVAVPQVRQAVHRATAPTAKAKPKLIAPAAAGPKLAMNCPSETPVMLTGGALSPMPQSPQFASAPPVPTGGGIPYYGGGIMPPADGPFFIPVSGGGGGGGGGGINPPAPPGSVPEPATWVQMLIGFGVIGGATRVVYRHEKRRKREDGEEAEA
ncbi:MAG: hypothetical protein DI623_03900 [Sphingomonas sanxanigenens]|uniref:Uncharacterized protein n=1 Tax=Sphingomonas sanxanigenens TaxID=397260 RepID=A0A2W5ADL2_9SPHN|nr:MAG: hypothetical protein DI623_03900 [Sphingomonas sanxanigenens]